MTNDQAQSSNAPFFAWAEVARPRAPAQASTEHEAHARLLKKIQDMGLAIAASAMRSDSTPDEPRLENVFFRISDGAWKIAESRQKRYQNFAGIRIQFELQRNWHTSEHIPTQGLKAELLHDDRPQDATISLIPCPGFLFNTQTSIDAEVLGQLAPRITRVGEEGNYFALLKSVARMTFDSPELASHIQNWSTLTSERDLAQHTLAGIARSHVSSYSYVIAWDRLRRGDEPQKAFKLAQKLGTCALPGMMDMHRLMQAYAENFPGDSSDNTRIVHVAHNIQIAPPQLPSACAYFEGPITALDISHANMRQTSRGSHSQQDTWEHTNLSPSVLQRIEILHRGWTDEPIAVDVIHGITHVAPLECMQRISLQMAYENGLIPSTANVVRVNATLQETTPPGASYEGKFLGATLHHIYLLNKRAEYEAHLKCLLPPQDLTALLCNREPFEANANVSIHYNGPDAGASIGLAQNKTWWQKMAAFFNNSSARIGNQQVEQLQRNQQVFLRDISINLIGPRLHHIFHPIPALSRAALGQAHSPPVHAAIVGEAYDGVVPGCVPDPDVTHVNVHSPENSASIASARDDFISQVALTQPAHGRCAGAGDSPTNASLRVNTPRSVASLPSQTSTTRSRTPSPHLGR